MITTLLLAQGLVLHLPSGQQWLKHRASGISMESPVNVAMSSANDNEEKLRRFLEGVIVLDGRSEEDEEDAFETGGGGGDDSAVAESALAQLRNFDMRPKEVHDFLDQYVIHQAEAKKVLSVAVCDHYNHVRRCLQDGGEPGVRDYAKPNILLLGPTGVGKTYLIRTLSRLICVPFVKADATKFSETGVVGKDVEDLVRELVDAAGGNHTLAQFGIVYVDEVDKITQGAGTHGGGEMRGGWNTRGVQSNFLKLLEETEVSTQSPMAAAMGGMGGPFGRTEGPASINTRHMLFVFSGAFHALDRQIQARRDSRPSLGFHVEAQHTTQHRSEHLPCGGGDDDGDDSDDEEGEGGDGQGEADEVPPRSALCHALTSDFIAAGLEPEFIGRIPVRVACEPLGEVQLRRILVESRGSVLRQFEDDFRGYGISLQFDEAALTQVARMAAAEETGARGLLTVLEQTLRDFKFELPSSAVTTLLVDNATVVSPRRSLKRLLRSEAAGGREAQAALALADLKRFEASFEREHAPLRVWFTDAAVDCLVAAALEQRTSAFSLARRNFEQLPATLRRVASVSGQQHFPISEDMAREPDVTIAAWLASLDKAA